MPFQEFVVLMSQVLLRTHLVKHHDSLFNPALPKCKVDAIERMGFGNVEKVFFIMKPLFGRKGIIMPRALKITRGTVSTNWAENKLRDEFIYEYLTTNCLFE
jgi:hypothetical protein